MSRIDHQSITKHFKSDKQRLAQINNEFEDEFLYFNTRLRQVFDQNAQSFNQMIETQLSPQIRTYLKTIVQS